MHTRLDTVVIPNALRSGPLPGETGQGATLLGLALDEAAATGARRIVVVGDGRCPSMRGKAEVVCIPQVRRRGLGGALLAAEPHVGPGPIGVILPDELIRGGTCLAEMASAYWMVGVGHMVGIVPVPVQDTSLYGIVDPLTTVGMGRLVRTVGIVEKPGPNAAPSTLAVAGRYILHRRIFDDLRALGRRDPLCLTAAIDAGIERVGLTGFEITAPRYDCSRSAHLIAAVAALTPQQARVGRVPAA